MQDFAELKAKQQAAWATGDYAVIGSTILLTAELLAEALDLRSGWTVLDVAAGNGNMSLAAARRGARVTSTDYVPALLERGKLRAEAEGWRIEFAVADAEQLPFAEGSYDCVVSTFGVMFAPDQARAAAEMMRVCRLGGKIGLASWTPDGFVGQIFRTVGRYVAPAPGVSPASLWGTERRLEELFAGAQKVEARTKTFAMRAASVEDWLKQFRKLYGPMQRTFAALEEGEAKSLEADLLALARGMNRAADGTMVVPSEYLEAVITR